MAEQPTLNESSSSRPCTSTLGQGTLTVELDIRQHHLWKSCKSIHAVFLHHTAGNEDEEIGYINARLLDKTTKGPRGGDVWMKELLGYHNYGKEHEELVTTMSDLHLTRGVLRPPFWQYDELENDHILYVDGFWLEDQFEGCGLGREVFGMFHDLLPSLDKDEKFGISGCTMLLVPGMMKGHEYGRRSKQEVQDRLVTMYGRAGYRVLVRHPADAEELTLMARKL